MTNFIVRFPPNRDFICNISHCCYLQFRAMIRYEINKGLLAVSSMQEFFLLKCYQKLLQEVIKKSVILLVEKILLILGKSRMKYRVFFYISSVTHGPF